MDNKEFEVPIVKKSQIRTLKEHWLSKDERKNIDSLIGIGHSYAVINGNLVINYEVKTHKNIITKYVYNSILFDEKLGTVYYIISETTNDYMLGQIVVENVDQNDIPNIVRQIGNEIHNHIIRSYDLSVVYFNGIVRGIDYGIIIMSIVLIGIDLLINRKK